MALTPGTAIGPYRLTEPAGAGGMAQVWRAYDTRLDRYVAIKFLSPQFATDPSYLERFRREARAISRFDHPNILTIYDFGEQESWTDMVSPFIGGGTLAGRLRRGPWALADTLPLLEPLASALDYAHAEGVVHRDVKPSNVLITERGRVVLSDFGIARMVEGTTLMSQAGLVVGTPMYMSPEQADGERAGPASDLYSFGVVAYEMLTGRPPFMGETPLALLRAHLDKPLPPPRSLNRGLPDAVEAALFKIMAKNPADRYPTGEAFIAALKAAAAGPAPARPVDPRATTTVQPVPGDRDSASLPPIVRPAPLQPSAGPPPVTPIPEPPPGPGSASPAPAPFTPTSGRAHRPAAPAPQSGALPTYGVRRILVQSFLVTGLFWMVSIVVMLALVVPFAIAFGTPGGAALVTMGSLAIPLSAFLTVFLLRRGTKRWLIRLGLILVIFGEIGLWFGLAMNNILLLLVMPWIGAAIEHTAWRRQRR